MKFLASKSTGGSTMGTISWRRLAGLLGALGLLLLLASDHASDPVSASTASSLPSVSSGARPGLDVLYASVPPAPQLENCNPRFNASPVLFSATAAYANVDYLCLASLYG